MTIIILLPCRNDYKKYSPRRGTDHAGRVGIYGQKADRRGRIADPYGVMQPRNVFCTVERGDDGWQTEKLAFSVWTEHGRVAGLVVRASKKPPSRRGAFVRFVGWFPHQAANASRWVAALL